MKSSLIIRSCFLILVLSLTSEITTAQRLIHNRNVCYGHMTRTMKYPISVEKSLVIQRNSFSSKDRLALVKVYLSKNEHISSKKYAKITGLSKQIAELELDYFSQNSENRITVVQLGKEKLYTKS